MDEELVPLHAVDFLAPSFRVPLRAEGNAGVHCIQPDLKLRLRYQ